MFDVGSSLANALGLLASVDDIVTGRVDEDEPPPWCVRRGWSDF